MSNIVAGVGVSIVFLLFLCASPLQAMMEEVPESELSLISAQAGISYNWGDSKIRITYDSYHISDTDHDPVNWLEFNDITISGPDGYFTLDGRTEDPLLYQFNSIDIGTMTTIDDKTRTFVNFVDATNTNPRIWNIGHMVFCTQDLGSIQFDARNIDPTMLKASSHGEGASGLEFEYLSNWLMEDFSYAYNTSGDTLSISGIHIAEFASGLSDNPADPSTWDFYGRFQIGDLYGGVIDNDNDPENAAVSNPASMDVLTDDAGTYVVLNLPMKGTIRAEAVTFGGKNFGSIAIDGINAHHIYVKFNTGN